MLYTAGMGAIKAEELSPVRTDAVPEACRHLAVAFLKQRICQNPAREQLEPVMRSVTSIGPEQSGQRSWLLSGGTFEWRDDVLQRTAAC